MLQVQTNKKSALKFYKNNGYWINNKAEIEDLPGNFVNHYENKKTKQKLHWIKDADNIAFASLHYPPCVNNSNQTLQIKIHQVVKHMYESALLKHKHPSRRSKSNISSDNDDLIVMIKYIYGKCEFIGNYMNSKLDELLNWFRKELIQKLKITNPMYEQGTNHFFVFPMICPGLRKSFCPPQHPGEKKQSSGQTP